MKAIIQRVVNASVTVNGVMISSIERGFCVLIGISRNDTLKDMEYIVRKLLSIKLFDDESNKRWKKSIVEKQYEILCVSQFTLYNTWKGTKPDFHYAMAGDKSKQFYEDFLQMLRAKYLPEKVKAIIAALLAMDRQFILVRWNGNGCVLWFGNARVIPLVLQVSIGYDGEFGAYMQVNIQNDGPVTFEIESPLAVSNKERKTVEDNNKEAILVNSNRERDQDQI